MPRVTLRWILVLVRPLKKARRAVSSIVDSRGDKLPCSS